MLLLLEDVGWGLALGRLGVVCGRSMFWGYIPGRLSCRSIRSASAVTRSTIVFVSYNSGNTLMLSYALNDGKIFESPVVIILFEDVQNSLYDIFM